MRYNLNQLPATVDKPEEEIITVVARNVPIWEYIAGFLGVLVCIGIFLLCASALAQIVTTSTAERGAVLEWMMRP
jgi:uncharacterized membrane protein YdcZ (DUF606 family)